MDTTKQLLRNVPEYLLYFGATDLVCLLLSFAVNAAVRPILVELAREDSAKIHAIDVGLWIFFAILFFGVLAAILAKSSIQRSAYLAATIDREYRFGADVLGFCKSGLPIGAAAYFLFCLPVTVLVAIWPEIQYIPALFYPQYALIELTSPLIALLLDVLFYAVFALVLFPILHLYWEKNRLHK